MIQTLLNVLLIILGFGILIFVHELGHFLAAKWAGIRAEAFAIGMGPVALAYRKGIGVRFGSTAGEYQRRVVEHLKSKSAGQVVPSQSDPRDEELPPAQFYRIGDSLGLGETEYSLRWLPIGGFVKMLGQEDANPNYVSDDPRSYNMRPIGKRMVVVSAGVIMNLILAIVLFVFAFMIGVRFPAPIVGDVSSRLAAGTTMPENAQALGVTEPGLMPGDRVVSIDGDAAETFADLQIASAMSTPESNITFVVQRAGIDQHLVFRLQPRKDPATGLLSVGVAPGASNRLMPPEHDRDGLVSEWLTRTSLSTSGVEPGMSLLTVEARDVTAYGQLEAAAERSEGRAIPTTWGFVDEGGETRNVVEAVVPVRPDYEVYLQRSSDGDTGLLGLSPLTRFVRASEGSQNEGIIRNGDVLLKIAEVPYPRRSQLFEVLREHKRQSVSMTVLRDGLQVPITAQVNKDGQLRVEIEPADDLLISAQPVLSYSQYGGDAVQTIEDLETPAGRSMFFTTGGTRILAVEGQRIRDWSQFRTALLQHVSGSENQSSVTLSIQNPVAGSPEEEVELALSDKDVARLSKLSWSVELPNFVFEPLYVVRKGSPLQAVRMGFEETHKMVMMTYLTIDRLIRGTVGVDQLRGPVGIVHIGAQIAREGLMKLLFFLGAISVNLAVINFLPLPIVDGGLFLFLVYEKLKGRPPSLAFQNLATVVGLLIIGSLFLVTFYNDILRLFS